MENAYKLEEVNENKKGEVINFPNVKLKKDKTPKQTHNNSIKGVSHKVYPLKNKEDIEAIKDYFRNKMSNAKNKEDKQIAAKYLLLFTLGINVGLRIGDLIKFTWRRFLYEDMTFVDGIVIQEEKTEKYKTFYLNKNAQDAIMEYINEFNIDIKLNKYIFDSREGKHIGGSVAYKTIKDAAKESGIKQNIGTHTIRKTWGYHQLKAHQGDVMFLTKLQSLFNHSSQIATLCYCGLEDEQNKMYYNDINL